MGSLSGPQQREVVRNELRGLEDWKNLGKISGVGGVRVVVDNPTNKGRSLAIDCLGAD